MANQLNDFDRLIKETYENHEFPYDSSVWDGVEKELGATAPGILDFFQIRHYWSSNCRSRFCDYAHFHF